MSRSGRPRSGSSISSRSGGYSRAGAVGGGSAQPAVAAQAAVPAHAVDLAHDERVLAAHARGVEADQLVARDAADQQLPVQARDEAGGARADAGRRSGGVGHALTVPVRRRSLRLARRAGEVEGLGDELVGAPAGLVVVGDADDDELVGGVLLGDLAQAGGDGLRRADARCAGRAAWRRAPGPRTRGSAAPCRAAAPGPGGRGAAAPSPSARWRPGAAPPRRSRRRWPTRRRPVAGAGARPVSTKSVR